MATDPIEKIRVQLKEVGLRATPARIATLQQLQQAEAPITHAEIADTLVPLGYDKATVFRNLTDLTDAKLISRTELGDRVWRFELRSEHGHDEHHPHFVCVECGSVSCLKEMQFTNASQRSANVIGEITEILIKGLCKECIA